MKFLKKQVEVNAIQFDGKNSAEIIEFAAGAARMAGKKLKVKTSNGEVEVKVTDFVIQGPEDFYPCPETTFVQLYDDVMVVPAKGDKEPDVAGDAPGHEEKSLGNTDVNGAKKNVSDLVTFGDGDTFQLICKASSQAQGWMKSTKAMHILGAGCVIQVTTQQGDHVAEALIFVPGVKIMTDADGVRSIVKR